MNRFTLFRADQDFIYGSPSLLLNPDGTLLIVFPEYHTAIPGDFPGADDRRFGNLRYGVLRWLGESSFCWESPIGIIDAGLNGDDAFQLSLPGLVRLPDRPEIALFHDAIVGTPAHNTISTRWRVSLDNGFTWSGPMPIADGFGNNDGVTVSSDGHLVLGVGKRILRAANPDAAANPRNWEIVYDGPDGLCEPHLTLCGDGSLLAHFRRPNGSVLPVRSTDNGAKDTWEAGGLVGEDGSEFLTSIDAGHGLEAVPNTGIVLMVHYFNPAGIRIRAPTLLRVSRDNGRSWSAPVQNVLEGAENTDFSNPSLECDVTRRVVYIAYPVDPMGPLEIQVLPFDELFI